MFDREIMQTDLLQNQSTVPISSFESRFTNEIKIAKLFQTSKNLNELLICLKLEIRQYFGAEAFTIYSADNKKKEIVSKVIAGRLRQEIRLPIDKNSMSGYTALTRLSLKVMDAYDEDELKSIDQELRLTEHGMTKQNSRPGRSYLFQFIPIITLITFSASYSFSTRKMVQDSPMMMSRTLRQLPKRWDVLL